MHFTSFFCSLGDFGGMGGGLALSSAVGVTLGVTWTGGFSSGVAGGVSTGGVSGSEVVVMVVLVVVVVLEGWFFSSGTLTTTARDKHKDYIISPGVHLSSGCWVPKRVHTCVFRPPLSLLGPKEGILPRCNQATSQLAGSQRGYIPV